MRPMETVSQQYEGYRQEQAPSASARVNEQYVEPHYPAWQAAGKLQPTARGNLTASQHLALAIVSVITTGIFSMVILTSVQDSYISLLGVGIMSSAIFLINAVVHWKM